VLTRLRQSLTTRLLIVFILTSVLLTMLLVGSLFHAVRTQWRGTIAPHIEQYLDYVNEDLGYPPNRERALALSDKLSINIYIEGPDISFSTTGNPLDVSDLEFRESHAHVKRRERRNRKALDPTIRIGEHNDRTVVRNQRGEYSVFYELRHRDQRPRERDRLWPPILILGAILGGCYWLLRRLLRPVQDISSAVRAMGAGRLDTRVPVRSGNDLGVLAQNINTMASDIEQLLDAKRQLLLGASHELRTPVTRAKLAAEMLADSNNRTRIIEDLNEMESLITEIMESERISGGHSVLTLTQVSLPALIASVLEALNCTASTICEFDDTLPVLQADATRLRLLFRNLISNAIKHGDSAQPILIKARVTDRFIRTTVTDYGEGIAAEHLDKITEPFYRADPSRARATGGFGLGLHLCELIVQAHGGRLSLDSTPGQGTVVTVDLPLSHGQAINQ
jgi:signal transduction histidine kinase